MIKAKCIIIESSYLIRKGLESFLGEIGIIDVMRVFANIEEAIPFIENSNFQIVFAGDKSIKEFSVENFYMISTENNKKVVEILTEKKECKNQNFIHLGDDKSDMIHKIESIVEDLSIVNNEEKDSVLSSREETILRHVALGLTNKEIAEKLFLSAHTVITHRKNITKKLGIKTVSGLTIYSIINNIISMDDVN